MLGTLAAGHLALSFEQNGTLVILAEHRLRQSAALRIHAAVCPHDVWHHVICSNQFSFG
jgi:hypothetical protein